MKIMVISDIHGSLYYLNKIIKIFKKNEYDYILILGDELYHGPRNDLPKEYNPKETAKVLNELRDKIIAVRGNCDAEVDQIMLEYPIMSDYTIILSNRKKIFATHGHIYNDEKMPYLSKGDIFLYGHTHIYRLELKNGIYILNPGSISLAKNGNENTYGVLENDVFYIKNLEEKEVAKIELK